MVRLLEQPVVAGLIDVSRVGGPRTVKGVAVIPASGDGIAADGDLGAGHWIR